MNVFQAAKQVKCSDAARFLGLKEGHKRFLCPFHDDHDPSMLCHDDSPRFYCFACNAKGDAVDLWAKVKGLPPREAADELCRAFGLSHQQESAQERAARKHKEDVALLPRAVYQDWHRVMVDVLQEEINAATRMMALYDDPEGWVVRHALERAVRLNDESVRLQALLPEELEEEIQGRRSGKIPSVGLPPVDAEMLLDILADRLRHTGIRLTSQECAGLHRILGIPGASAEGSE